MLDLMNFSGWIIAVPMFIKRSARWRCFPAQDFLTVSSIDSRTNNLDGLVYCKFILSHVRIHLSALIPVKSVYIFLGTHEPYSCAEIYLTNHKS